MPNTAARFRSARTLLVLTLAFMLALTLLIVFARTFAEHRSSSTAPLSYPVPALDVSAAVLHLSSALQIETISYDDAIEAGALERFRSWLVQTYPRFHA